MGIVPAKKSTRAIDPSLSLAEAARVTVAGAVTDVPFKGLVSATSGVRLAGGVTDPPVLLAGRIVVSAFGAPGATHRCDTADSTT
jgi:hypothetical protein